MGEGGKGDLKRFGVHIRLDWNDCIYLFLCLGSEKWIWSRIWSWMDRIGKGLDVG